MPPYIQSPPYAETGSVPDSPKSIEIKTDEQIAAMKVACGTARKVINIARDYIKVRLFCSLAIILLFHMQPSTARCFNNKYCHSHFGCFMLFMC